MQVSFPKTVPIRRRMVFLAVFFAALALFLLICAIPTLLSQEILMEDDTPMPSAFKWFLAVACGVCSLGLLSLAIPILLRVFRKRGAMTLTCDGVEDTFLIFTVLAFWTLLRVRCIPWEALSPDSENPEQFTVNLSLLPRESVGGLARLMLRIGGFPYSIGRISADELGELREAALQAKTLSDSSTAPF